MTVQEKTKLQEEIESLNKRISEIKDAIYEDENKEFISRLEYNVGRYFRKRNPGMGATHILRVNSFNKKYNLYNVLTLTSQLFLVGHFYVNIESHNIDCKDLNDNFEEITKEDFDKMYKEELEFLNKEII